MVKKKVKSARKTKFHQALEKLIKKKEYHDASSSSRLEMLKKELESFNDKKIQTI
jgi:hypothetical protein